MPWGQENLTFQAYGFAESKVPKYHGEFITTSKPEILSPCLD
jgi:hypothetical protein